MGHRANFVVIEDGKAEAFYDQWAGLGCAFAISEGPARAVDSARESEPTTELLDWAFAEGGYLIDFDEQVVIVFGELEDFSDEFGDFDEDGADDDSDDDEPEDDADEDDDAAEDAYAQKYQQYFDEIAPNWAGWRLRWDDRGVDAFAEHLQRRGIADIECQEFSHPEDSRHVELQA
jgi:hypothetical protein